MPSLEMVVSLITLGAAGWSEYKRRRAKRDAAAAEEIARAAVDKLQREAADAEIWLDELMAQLGPKTAGGALLTKLAAQRERLK